MTFTNQGNKYKFQAIMKRREGQKDVVIVQRLLKSGKWGKPHETRRYGNETDKQVIERLEINNKGDHYRIAQ